MQTIERIKKKPEYLKREVKDVTIDATMIKSIIGEF